MHHRPASAFTAAALCAGGLVLTGVLARIVPIAQLHDSATLYGFTTLAGHARVSRLATDVAHLVDPQRYLIAAVALVAVALLRRRTRAALAVPLAMFAASATTELLKPIVAHARYSDWLGSDAQISAASWPSGHATAAMTVALCAVLVAPAGLRPLVALLGTGLAVGVSYSILVLGWHFPSDVLGGFLVAGTWVSLAVAAIWTADLRRPRPSPPKPRDTTASSVAAAGLLAPAALLAATFAAALAALAVRGRLVETYGAAHLSFVAGALAIAALAAALATGMAVALRH